MTLPLLDLIKADHYVVSTSGARFKHPDEEAMARVITSGRPHDSASPTLWFNYASATTEPWLAPRLAERYRYEAQQPKAPDRGAVIGLV